MRDDKVIQDNTPRIDYDNLCGGNDFASLTDNYSRVKIDALLWSVQDSTDRYFASRAIFLQKKLDKCPEDDDEQYEQITCDRVDLQKAFDDEKRKRRETQMTAIGDKAKGYNAIESSVLMYFLLDSHSVNFTNNGEKNCLQKDVKQTYSHVFGFSEKTYEDKIVLDFTDPATRKAMEKVAKDLEKIAPAVAKEILHQYNEYEDDYIDKKSKKNKSI